MTKKKQWLALLTAVAVLFVMLFSAIYIIENSNHDCCGSSDCSICYHIGVCRDILKTLSFAVGVAIVMSALSWLLCRSVCFCTNHVRCLTPVYLKVKLLS